MEAVPRPGEVSLAHQGVLFLDELPEFDRSVLEVLRQPLEDQKVTISRAAMSLTFPASFMLAAAMNPCPCGFWNDPTRECRCSPLQIQRYVGRISGPLFDRIDIHIDVPAVKFRELAGDDSPETDSSDDDSQSRDKSARATAESSSRRKIFSNAAMTPRMIRRHCQIDAHSEQMLESAMTTPRPLGPRLRSHSESQPHDRGSRRLRKDRLHARLRSGGISIIGPHLLDVM